MATERGEAGVVFPDPGRPTQGMTLTSSVSCRSRPFLLTCHGLIAGHRGHSWWWDYSPTPTCELYGQQRGRGLEGVTDTGPDLGTVSGMRQGLAGAQGRHQKSC